MLNKLRISSSPHIRSECSVNQIMIDVLIALTPMMAMSLIIFKWHAVLLLLSCSMSALLIEWIIVYFLKKPIDFLDVSPVITGILLAMVIPSTLPIWMAVVGVLVAILFGKMVFGGLGYNIFNPALVGRCFLLASWPVAMTNWSGFDANTGPTVLNAIKMYGNSAVGTIFSTPLSGYMHLLIGDRAGSLGETSILAILLGGAYLLYRRVISWHTPTAMIATVFILSWLVGRDPIIAIFSGGLFLGAFFMATDMVTTPHTPLGKTLFGLGAGALVVWIRVKGGYPEGVAYAILLMNALTPLINRLIPIRPFGRKERERA